jgi:mitochondrial cardiolipin hydrolase
MDLAELKDLMVQTFDDYRLSRSERKVLKEVFDESELEEVQREQLRRHAFQVVRNHLDGPHVESCLQWLESTLKLLVGTANEAPWPESHVYFSPGTACLNAIVNQLQKAKKSVEICVFTITDDRISREIAACHRRGVVVRILTDNDKSMDQGSDIDGLANVGIAVRCDHSEHHMHHKFAIFDREWLLSGSYNWTRSAASHNQENVVLSADPRLIRKFRDQFELLWKKFALGRADRLALNSKN